MGGPEVLTLVSDWTPPARKPGQVLVATVSIGVNPVDIIVRSGHYKPESFPKVGGWVLAGRLLVGACVLASPALVVCAWNMWVEAVRCVEPMGVDARWGEGAKIVEEPDPRTLP